MALDWRSRSAQWRAAGLCSQCGQPRAPGRKLCQRHIDYHRERSRQVGAIEVKLDEPTRYRFRRPCFRCGKLAVIGRAGCEIHTGEPPAKLDRRTISGRRIEPRVDAPTTDVVRVAVPADAIVPVRSSWVVGRVAP